jgi:hypothetical protein
VIHSEKYDTGLPLHTLQTKHKFDFEKAEILCQEPNWRKRKLLEALHIELTENTCNIHKGLGFYNNWITFHGLCDSLMKVARPKRCYKPLFSVF